MIWFFYCKGFTNIDTPTAKWKEAWKNVNYNCFLKFLLTSNIFNSMQILLAKLSQICVSKLYPTGKGEVRSASQRETVNIFNKYTIYYRCHWSSIGRSCPQNLVKNSKVRSRFNKKIVLNCMIKVWGSDSPIPQWCADIFNLWHTCNFIVVHNWKNVMWKRNWAEITDQNWVFNDRKI